MVLGSVGLGRIAVRRDLRGLGRLRAVVVGLVRGLGVLPIAIRSVGLGRVLAVVVRAIRGLWMVVAVVAALMVLPVAVIV